MLFEVFVRVETWTCVEHHYEKESAVRCGFARVRLYAWIICLHGFDYRQDAVCAWSSGKNHWTFCTLFFTSKTVAFAELFFEEVDFFKMWRFTRPVWIIETMDPFSLVCEMNISITAVRTYSGTANKSCAFNHTKIAEPEDNRCVWCAVIAHGQEFLRQSINQSINQSASQSVCPLIKH